MLAKLSKQVYASLRKTSNIYTAIRARFILFIMLFIRPFSKNQDLPILVLRTLFSHSQGEIPKPSPAFLFFYEQMNQV